jgi:hypothetical protein
MGYKGNGILSYLIVDTEGMPLSECHPPADERKQVKPLLERIEMKTG